MSKKGNQQNDNAEQDLENMEREDGQQRVDQMTPEQLAEYKEMRKQATAELKEEIEYLKVEVEYQDLMAQVEENKLRHTVAIVRQIQVTSPPQQPAQQPGAPAPGDPARPPARPTQAGGDNKGPRKLAD